MHRGGHWHTSSWQTAPAVSLICLLCNKSIVIILYIIIFGVFVCPSGPRAAPESLIWPSLWKGCPPLHYSHIDCSKTSVWYRSLFLYDIYDWLIILRDHFFPRGSHTLIFNHTFFIVNIKSNMLDLLPSLPLVDILMCCTITVPFDIWIIKVAH